MTSDKLGSGRDERNPGNLNSLFGEDSAPPLPGEDREKLARELPQDVLARLYEIAAMPGQAVQRPVTAELWLTPEKARAIIKALAYPRAAIGEERTARLEKALRQARNYVEFPLRLMKMEPAVDMTEPKMAEAAAKHQGLLDEIDAALSSTPSSIAGDVR